ncbi:MAG: TldD/PmbA family protein [Oscillospiraceae bacterium]|jgi:PmbA protein|nr:TldD/PmbA family protein [Oscillospiraceae bacterium]
MTYEEFKREIIKNAEAAGIAEYDLYYSRGLSTTVFAFKEEISDFSDKTSVGLCFRCITDGKTGYSHTQRLDAEEAVRLVEDAKACAGIIESDEFSIIYSGSESYNKLPPAAEISVDASLLIEKALEIESKAKAKDPRVLSVDYAISAFSYGETALYNSHGLDLREDRSACELYCSLVVEDGGRKYIGFEGKSYASSDKMDTDGVAGKAVDMAIGAIGGKSVKSGQYPVIFSSRTAAEMLGAFAGIFSADAAQKGLSLLAGKEGEKIAAPVVTIMDDPFHPESNFTKTSFDGEGVATYTKHVIKNGVLKTLLYDLKSAAKAGKASTGNGMKASFASNVEVSPTNLLISPGEHSLEELMQKAGTALYITELKGLHASADSSTGDFSLESKGYLIENGKISRPAEQFTVAGNFYRLLEDITALGNDFQIESAYGAPSALISGLAVAGE